MSRRPRLLFLGQTLPYPPDSGAKIRSYNVLRQLCRGFDVTALCFYRKELVGDRLESSVDTLRSLAEVEVFPIPQEGSRARLLMDHLRSSLTGRVYTRYAYESREYRRAVRRAMSSGEHQVVHADSLDLSGYFDLVHDRPLVCVHHNVESELLRRRAEAASGLHRRAYLRYQARLMEREEDRWCPRVDLNVTVSERDRRTLEDRTEGGSYTVVPNGVDVDFFRPAESEIGDGVVSIGGVEWLPNWDALDFFCEEILWRIRKQRPDVPVRWIGRCPDQLRERYSREFGIEMTGYVEDVRLHLARGECFVVPLRIGGGTRLKILTAWAMGLPVVSTSVGCEGLEAVDGENILIRDDPADFSEGVLQLLEDGDLRSELSENARATVENTYSWEAIGDRMLPAYRRLAEG